MPKLITQLPNYPITNYKIIGNIPFYVTGYLFRVLGELKNKPSLIVFFLQKEVAQRICAKPSKMNPPHRQTMWGMNLLAASIQFWAEPEIIDYISKKDFKPEPKVDSAIIKLSPRTYADWTRTDAENYYKFIKILFKQPRKTIINNLRPTINDLQQIKEKLKKLGINSNDRPQNLDIKQIKELSTLF